MLSNLGGQANDLGGPDRDLTASQAPSPTPRWLFPVCSFRPDHGR